MLPKHLIFSRARLGLALLAMAVMIGSAWATYALHSHTSGADQTEWPTVTCTCTHWLQVKAPEVGGLWAYVSLDVTYALGPLHPTYGGCATKSGGLTQGLHYQFSSYGDANYSGTARALLTSTDPGNCSGTGPGI